MSDTRPLLTTEQVRDYITETFTTCPYCGDSDITADAVSADGNSAWCDVVCSGCGAGWIDVYTLTAVSVRDADGKHLATINPATPTPSRSPDPEFASCVDLLIAVAEAHGKADDPDHEVGDLKDFFLVAVALLTAEQQRAFWEHVVIHEIVTTIPEFANLAARRGIRG